MWSVPYFFRRSISAAAGGIAAALVDLSNQIDQTQPTKPIDWESVTRSACLGAVGGTLFKASPLEAANLVSVTSAGIFIWEVGEELVEDPNNSIHLPWEE